MINQRTFTIFVDMNLVTSLATTPLTSVLYSPWYQKRLAFLETRWNWLKWKSLHSERIQRGRLSGSASFPKPKKYCYTCVWIACSFSSTSCLYCHRDDLSSKAGRYGATPLLPTPLEAHDLCMTAQKRSWMLWSNYLPVHDSTEYRRIALIYVFRIYLRQSKPSPWALRESDVSYPVPASQASCAEKSVGLHSVALPLVESVKVF